MNLSEMSNEELMKVAFPGPKNPPANYDDLVRAAASKYEVPENLALGVHRTEYDPKRWASPKGARGPMQLTPETAERFGVDPDDPAQNIEGGMQYLKFLLDRYKDQDTALMAYHAGEGNVDRDLQDLPSEVGPKTRAYPGKVMGAIQNFFSPSEASAAAISNQKNARAAPNGQDLSQMSDEQLAQIAGVDLGQQTPGAQQTPRTQTDLSSMSNEDLARIAGVDLASESSQAALLSPEEEGKFQKWYGDWAKTSGMNPNPDDPQHHYDYRAAFKAGVQPPEKGGHWPSQFKANDHPNRFVIENGRILDSKTGRHIGEINEDPQTGPAVAPASRSNGFSTQAKQRTQPVDSDLSGISDERLMEIAGIKPQEGQGKNPTSLLERIARFTGEGVGMPENPPEGIEAMRADLAKKTEQPAESAGQFITEKLPASAMKLATDTFSMPGDIAATVTKPFFQTPEEKAAYDESVRNAPGHFLPRNSFDEWVMKTPGVSSVYQGADELMTGLATFIGEPLGFGGWDAFKRRWLGDPVGSVAAVAPVASVFLKSKGFKSPTKTDVANLVDEAVRNPEHPASQEFMKGIDGGLKEVAPESPAGSAVSKKLAAPAEETYSGIPPSLQWIYDSPALKDFYSGEPSAIYKPDSVRLLQSAMDDLRAGENPHLKVTEGYEPSGAWEKKYERIGSSNPDWFVDSGWKKKNVEQLVSKIERGERLTARQRSFAESMIDAQVNKEVGLYGPEAERWTQTVKLYGGGPDTGPWLRQTASEIKDLAREAPGKAREVIEFSRTAGKSLWESYSKPPKWTEFKDALGKYLGARQIANHQNREFIKRINGVAPERLRQDGITNWIEAGGDLDLLKKRAEATKAPYLKKGYEAARDLTPEEIATGKEITEYFDRMAKEGIESGVLETAVDNYINHIWQKENPTTKKLRSELNAGLLETNFRFARKRLWESYFEGEQKGAIPRDKRAGFLVAKYHQSFAEAVAARNFIKSMLDGKASDGRPLVSVSGMGKVISKETPEAYLIRPRIKTEETADYRYIDHPALRKWKWAASDPEGNPIYLQGDMYVHPEAYRHLKNVLSKSAIRESKVGRAALSIVQNLKSTLLSLSRFHQTQEGLHAVFHKVNPFGAPAIDFTQPIQRSLVEHGLMVSDYNALSQFSEGLHGSGLVNKLPGIGNLSQKYGEYLFQDYIPRLKMKMAVDALERNTTRYEGKYTQDQILELTAKQSNAAFGELNYKMIGRNPTLQDAFRLLTLAPDFLEARAKFVGQAFKPGGREQAAALIRGAVGMYAVGVIGNMIINDGEGHWDKPFTLVVNGKDYTLRSVPGDLVHLFRDPRSFVYYRLNPTTARTLVEFVTGRDRFGHRRDFTEQVKDFFTSHVPIPFQGAVNKREQTLLDSALQSLGVSSYKHRTSAGQLMSDIKREGTRTDLSPEARKKYETKQEVLNLAKTGDMEGFRTRLGELRKEGRITAVEAKNIEKKARQEESIYTFSRLPIEDAIKVYKVADKSERQKFAPILRKKWARTHTETRKKLWPKFKEAFSGSGSE